MDQNVEITEVAAGYEAPVVLDAGAVVAVTLGTQTFDTSDDTQYKTS
ncbi:lasso RiPP family leader peptide-containing protein [Streptomyces sp. 21So2-11]